MFKKNKFLKIGSLLILAVLFFIYGVWNFWDPCLHKIISRTRSNDGKVEAIVTELDCGATTSTLTQVLIQKPNQEVNKNSKAIFGASKVYKLNVIWERDRHLVIEYGDAKIHEYKNFWYSKEVDDYKYSVFIEEIWRNRDLKISDVYNNR